MVAPYGTICAAAAIRSQRKLPSAMHQGLVPARLVLRCSAEIGDLLRHCFVGLTVPRDEWMSCMCMRPWAIHSPAIRHMAC